MRQKAAKGDLSLFGPGFTIPSLTFSCETATAWRRFPAVLMLAISCKPQPIKRCDRAIRAHRRTDRSES